MLHFTAFLDVQRGLGQDRYGELALGALEAAVLPNLLKLNREHLIG